MRRSMQTTVFLWTGRLLLPLFFCVSVFLCGPVPVYAQAGTTVTGYAVRASSEASTNAPGVITPRSTSASTNQNATISLNFEGVDLKTVLLYLADITGETILPDPTVKGEVTIINPKPVTPEEAKQIIFSILEMQGFTIIKHEHLIKIVKSGDAKTRPIETLQPPENVEKMDEDDIIRAQVIYPSHVSPVDVQKFLTPLMTKGAGQIIINEPTGAVILIDTGSNIKRLMEVVELIDRIIEGGEIEIRIKPLQYADETEMVSLLQSIFNSKPLQSPTAQKISISGAAQGTASGAAKGGAGSKTTSTELEVGKTEYPAEFIAETRMHALIIISATRNFKLILDIIDRLDVPSTEKDDTVHIYPLQHVKAEEIAETLNDIFSERKTSSSGRGTVARSDDRDDRRDIRRSQPPSRTSSSSSDRRTSSGSSISHLAGKVDVLFDEPSNSLIVITSPKYYAVVKRIIERLDRRTPQAWIQAMIVEVSRNKDYNFGIGWKKVVEADQIFGGNSDQASLVQALDTTLGPAFNEALREVKPGKVQGLSYSYGKIDDAGRYNPYMTLQVAEGVNDINVLSTPSILASNNKEAEIKIGQQYPIPRYSRGTGDDYRDYSYDYTDINIELVVTPRINRYREVALETKVTVKDNGGQAYADENSPPIVLDRNASTEVVVQDGQTLVIGGLIKDDFNTSVSKIPLLGDIPIIKHAFRNKDYEKKKTELLIFITPYVVETDVQGDTLTTSIRDKYRGVSGFVEDKDRELLYDELNTERSQLTIYDDWREFEKKIEYAEQYFSLPQDIDEDKPPEERRTLNYFSLPDTSNKKDPYQGELLDEVISDEETPDDLEMPIELEPGNDKEKAEMEDTPAASPPAETPDDTDTDTDTDTAPVDDATTTATRVKTTPLVSLLERERSLVETSGNNAD